MKTILIALLLALSCPVFAQDDTTQPVFMIKLKAVVNDSNSGYYYPAVLDRMKTDPGSITREELYYLYYGQLAQPGGKNPPYMINPEYGDFMRMAMNKNFKKAVPLGYTILDRSPVELEVLLHTMIAIKESGQEDPRFLEKRYRMLLSVIMATGDGKTKETAIKIAKVTHDGILKGALGFLGGEETLDFSDNKAFSVWTKKDGTKLYFEDVWAYSFE